MAAKKKRESPTRREKLDDTPVAIPLKFRRVETQADRMRRIIREEMSRAAEVQGYETFEEADDFSIPDDYDPSSPYEMSYEQELNGYVAGNQGSAEAEEGNAGEGGSETPDGVQQGGQGASGSPGGPAENLPGPS